MSDPDRDYSKFAVYGLFGAAGVLVVLIIIQKINTAALKAHSAQYAAKNPESPSQPAPTLPAGENSGAKRPEVPDGAKPQAQGEDPTAAFRAQLSAESEQSVKVFTDHAKISMPFPQDMQFSTFDYNDSMAGMTGYNPVTKTKLTALAYPKDVTASEVAAFLNSEGNDMPNMEQNPMRMLGSGQPLPPPNAT